MRQVEQGPNGRGQRFLDAFVAVEESLQKLAGLEARSSFVTMIEAAKPRSYAVRHYEIDLKEFADLRNAIVHRRRGGEPIADPHEETVRELEGIARSLADPPKLLQIVKGGKPLTLTPEQPIGLAAKIMADKDYSQIPIYAGSSWAGLLTTEAITWWLAEHLPDAGIIEDEPISSALSHVADVDNCRFMGRSATVFEGIAAFADAGRAGHRLDAVVITDGGRRDQQALGIATVFDVQRMHRAAGSRG